MAARVTKKRTIVAGSRAATVFALVECKTGALL
jgi:hypothetical protein